MQRAAGGTTNTIIWTYPPKRVIKMSFGRLKRYGARWADALSESCRDTSFPVPVGSRLHHSLFSATGIRKSSVGGHAGLLPRFRVPTANCKFTISIESQNVSYLLMTKGKITDVQKYRPSSHTKSTTSFTSLLNWIRDSLWHSVKIYWMLVNIAPRKKISNATLTEIRGIFTESQRLSLL